MLLNALSWYSVSEPLCAEGYLKSSDKGNNTICGQSRLLSILVHCEIHAGSNNPSLWGLDSWGCTVACYEFCTLYCNTDSIAAVSIQHIMYRWENITHKHSHKSSWIMISNTCFPPLHCFCHPVVVWLVTYLSLLVNLCRLGLYSSCYDLGAGIYHEFSVAQFLFQHGSILSLFFFALLLHSPKLFVHFHTFQLSSCFWLLILILPKTHDSFDVLCDTRANNSW